MYFFFFFRLAAKTSSRDLQIWLGARFSMRATFSFLERVYLLKTVVSECCGSGTRNHASPHLSCWERCHTHEIMGARELYVTLGSVIARSRSETMSIQYYSSSRTFSLSKNKKTFFKKFKFFSVLVDSILEKHRQQHHQTLEMKPDDVSLQLVIHFSKKVGNEAGMSHFIYFCVFQHWMLTNKGMHATNGNILCCKNSNCRKTDCDLFMCAGCMNFKHLFCSRECQKSVFAQHRKKCRPVENKLCSQCKSFIPNHVNIKCFGEAFFFCSKPCQEQFLKSHNEHCIPAWQPPLPSSSSPLPWAKQIPPSESQMKKLPPLIKLSQTRIQVLQTHLNNNRPVSNVCSHCKMIHDQTLNTCASCLQDTYCDLQCSEHDRDKHSERFPQCVLNEKNSSQNADENNDLPNNHSDVRQRNNQNH